MIDNGIKIVTVGRCLRVSHKHVQQPIQVLASVMLLVPGRIPSQNTKIAESSTALANSGIEVVRIEVTEIVRSSLEPSRMPDSTPRPREIGTTTAKVAAARIAVEPRRGHMTLPTGSLKRTDSPKSPTTKLPAQRK